MPSRPEAPASPAGWNVTRPAIPEHLFRAPDPEEQPAGPDGPGIAGPLGLGGETDPDATVVRPVAPPTMAMPGPYLPGTPEGDLLPSERPYVAPLPPAPAQRSRRNGTRGVIILLVLLVVAAIIGGVLWFSGGGAPTAGGSPSAKRSATASTSAPASTAASAAAQTGSLPPSAPPSDAFPPQGATLCSGSTTVAVNATTSCEFADKVAAAIPPGSSGSFTVTANSPVTQKDYQMTCVRGSYTVCSGGVNAVVYVK
jgi:hypothetical protein